MIYGFFSGAMLKSYSTEINIYISGPLYPKTTKIHMECVYILKQIASSRLLPILEAARAFVCDETFARGDKHFDYLFFFV
jgi:hypothetical protein